MDKCSAKLLQGLFQRVIAQSGSFISSFTHWDKRPGVYGDRLAAEMGCPGNGFANADDVRVSRNVVECLQNISDPLLFAGMTKLFLNYPWTGPNIWKPIVDGHFAKDPVGGALSNHFSKQRTLTIAGSITVQLTSCLTGLDSTKQVKLMVNQQKQSSLIQTK